MKLITLSLSLMLLVFAFGASAREASVAGVDLPFSSTLDCEAWKQDGSTIVCQGISNDHINTYCNGNVRAQINPAGNHAGGGGGNGFRVPIGDGVNNSGGSPTIYLNTPQKEVWIRFYLRYPQGFKWSELSYHKLIYVSQAAKRDTAIVDMYASGSKGEVSLYIQSWGNGTWHHPDHRYEPSDRQYHVKNWGWDQIMDGSAGDGKWHYYEAHFKINSAPGIRDGIYQQWVDGRLVNNHRDVEWAASPFVAFAFSTNQSSPKNGGCVYVDWDDFAIRSDHYIGPVSGNDRPRSTRSSTK